MRTLLLFLTVFSGASAAWAEEAVTGAVIGDLRTSISKTNLESELATAKANLHKSNLSPSTGTPRTKYISGIGSSIRALLVYADGSEAEVTKDDVLPNGMVVTAITLHAVAVSLNGRGSTLPEYRDNVPGVQ